MIFFLAILSCIDDEDETADSDRQADIPRGAEVGEFEASNNRERPGSAHGSWSWIEANRDSPLKRPTSPSSLNNNVVKKHRSSSPTGSSASVTVKSNNVGGESPSIHTNKLSVTSNNNGNDSNTNNSRVYDETNNNIEHSATGVRDDTTSLSNHKEEANLDTGGIIISDTVTCINELTKCCPVAWNGALVLKNSSFSARMFLCSGDIALVDKYITDPENQSDRELPALKITQRLRLDPPKLEEVTRRMNADGIKNYCMFVILAWQPPTTHATLNNNNSPSATSATTTSHGSSGTPTTTTTNSATHLSNNNGNVDAPTNTDSENCISQSRPLRNLVGYLKQKDAAGVISLTDPSQSRDSMTFMYAFPPCNYAINLLRQVSPNLTSEATLKEDFLVGIIVKGVNS